MDPVAVDPVVVEVVVANPEVGDPVVVEVVVANPEVVDPVVVEVVVANPEVVEPVVVEVVVVGVVVVEPVVGNPEVVDAVVVDPGRGTGTDLAGVPSVDPGVPHAVTVIDIKAANPKITTRCNLRGENTNESTDTSWQLCFEPKDELTFSEDFLGSR